MELVQLHVVGFVDWCRMMTSKNGVGTRLLAIFIAVVTSKCAADNILVLHPFYAGSHVLTLHSVSEQLIKRGHSVTTVRYGQKIIKLFPRLILS